MTPHKILGLHFNATKEEAVSAYKRKVKECHPDLHPNDKNAKERFIKLTEAYETVLSQLENPSTSHEAPVDNTSQLKPIFIVVRRRMELTVSEAINGCTKTLDGVFGPCDNCGGSGRIPAGRPVECTSCYGTGFTQSKRHGFIALKVQCEDCNGTGKVDWFSCHGCGGFGRHDVHALDIDIPPGVRHGDKLTVPNGANNKKDNVIGDLEITVLIKDDKYRISGNDIEVIIRLNIWDVILGCDVRVPLPTGGACKLKIPENTVNGARFKIKGKGLHFTEEKGDLIAIIRYKPLKLSQPSVKEAMLLLKNASKNK